MAAGLSHKQFQSRVYNRLRSLEREAVKRYGEARVKRHGGQCIQIFSEDRSQEVLLRYYRLNASNGETCGMLNVNGGPSYGNVWNTVDAILTLNKEGA